MGVWTTEIERQVVGVRFQGACGIDILADDLIGAFGWSSAPSSAPRLRKEFIVLRLGHRCFRLQTPNDSPSSKSRCVLMWPDSMILIQ